MPSDTLVLLGAGASVDAGFPTAEELQASLLDTLGPLYRNLSQLAFGSNGADDPERLFRVLDFLHGMETVGREADRRPVIESLDIAKLVST